MTKRNFILFLGIIVFLFSCANKEAPQQNEDLEDNQAVAEQNNTPNESEEYSSSAALAPISVNAVDYYVVKKKYKLSKQTVNLLNDNLLEFLEIQRDNIPLESENNESESGEEPPVSNTRELALLVNNIDIDEDALKHAKNIFPKYTALGRSKFLSSKNIPEIDIQRFASYINSTLVVVKKVYETSQNKYLYDIVFLEGDIYDENNTWYRSSNEALPLVDSLNALKITNLNSYLNVVSKIEELPDILKYSSELDENNLDVNNNEEGRYKQTEDGETTADDTQESNNKEEKVEEKKVEEKEKKVVSPKEEKEKAEEIQKKLISFRLNTFLGFWRDVNNDEIYVIREITSNSSKNTHYAGYIILDTDAKKLNINKSLSWINEDLKFEFYINNKQGIYINEEKMPTSVKISQSYGKGTLILFLPNHEIRYIAPIIPDDSGFYYKNYKDLINLKPKQANYSKKLNAVQRYSNTLPETRSVSTTFLSWSLPLGIILLSIAFI